MDMSETERYSIPNDTTEAPPTHRTLETVSPENNLINRLQTLFYLASNVTRKSRTNGVERPLSHRNKRREILSEIKKLDRSDTEERKVIEGLLGEARSRDEILLQYMTQGEVSVDLDESGVQCARYALINPPETVRTAEKDSLPPIILLGGLSNDLEPMQPLTEEIAYQGRKVISIASPESSQGDVTDAFATEVVGSEDFAAHASFFKKAISDLKAKGEIVGETFELWGYSTGASVASLMLRDAEFSEQVENAAYICPAGSADQSLKQFVMGVMSEAATLIRKHPGLISAYSLSLPRKEENSPSKKKTQNGLISQIIKNHPENWKQSRVREGGKIVVISESNDQLTKSFLEEKTFKENPQVTLVQEPGSHLTPVTQPETVVKAVFSHQGSK